MLFCSVSGLPCRFPVVCTVCGAVYEESAARKRIADRVSCISGHELLPEACIPLKNGPIHSEESLEHVRISALSGVLDYFGSLVSSLASDNYGLRKQLAEKCSSDTPASISSHQAVASHLHVASPITSSSTRILELIQRHTPQLVAIRASLPLPPTVQLSSDSLEELQSRLRKHLTFSENPIFGLLSTRQKPFIGIESDCIWPIYQVPHANSDRVPINFIVISSRLYLEIGGTRLSITGTALLFVQSNYIYSAQDSILTLRDMLAILDLDTPPKVLVVSSEVFHVHPYGSCIYARCQDTLILTPLELDHLDHLGNISFSIAASVTSLSQTQLPSPTLNFSYEGELLGVNPDGRLLATYLPNQSTLLLSDICQLPYKFGPLLQYHLEDLHPTRIDWDGTGKQFTLLGQDGTSIQMKLERGTLSKSK
ncbi:Hypothetical protein GLP15_1590 [Giardia lamblia P15]|uniref:Uncharacterized protein n=1 Tax=Giardia intestinalis (strain P15) TaxID=658858 RepID=E1EX71_GIAIA|nr:Hypothetical protein GLP15_1590 [Giardia lamblia P15]